EEISDFSTLPAFVCNAIASISPRSFCASSLRSPGGNRRERRWTPTIAPPLVTRKATLTAPSPQCNTELQWIADHAREYKGQWMALHGNQYIAHIAIITQCVHPDPPIFVVE